MATKKTASKKKAAPVKKAAKKAAGPAKKSPAKAKSKAPKKLLELADFPGGPRELSPLGLVLAVGRSLPLNAAQPARPMSFTQPFPRVLSLLATEGMESFDLFEIGDGQPTTLGVDSNVTPPAFGSRAIPVTASVERTMSGGRTKFTLVIR